MNEIITDRARKWPRFSTHETIDYRCAYAETDEYGILRLQFPDHPRLIDVLLSLHENGVEHDPSQNYWRFQPYVAHVALWHFKQYFPDFERIGWATPIRDEWSDQHRRRMCTAPMPLDRHARQTLAPDPVAMHCTSRNMPPPSTKPAARRHDDARLAALPGKLADRCR